MELKAAMKTIRTDPDKGRTFLKDPAGTLKSMGVDTSSLHITTSTHSAPTGSTHGACGSAGCGVCASVG